MEIFDDRAQNWFDNYLHRQVGTLWSINMCQVKDLCNILFKKHNEGKTLYLIGNGGSASNCSHFMTDWAKGASSALKEIDQSQSFFKVISLTDNVSFITAIGNDFNYEEIFTRQLVNLVKPGDVLLGISVSGKSPNLVHAFNFAKQNGIYTVSIVGDSGRGLGINSLSDFGIVIKSKDYGIVEDCQSVILHSLSNFFIEYKINRTAAD